MRIQRINEIEQFLTTKGSATIHELCDKFKVSLNTIRRDIDELHDRGIVSKVYGGIVLNSDTHIVPLSTRSVSNLAEKQIICEIAAKNMISGSTIYIDSGTTTVPLLRHIDPNANITIVSNSLDVFSEATKYSGINVISIGGLLSIKTHSFIGVAAINQLKEYRINRAFLTATAVSIMSGATNNSYHESEIKKAVINQSNKIILMADHTKLSKQAALSFCPLDKVDTFVTDRRPPDEFIAFFDQNHVKLSYQT